MTRNEAVTFAAELEAEAKRQDSTLVKFPIATVARLLLPVNVTLGRQIVTVFGRAYKGGFRYSGLLRMLDYAREPWQIFCPEWKPGPLTDTEALEMLYRCGEVWDYDTGGFIPLDPDLRRSI